MLLEGHVNAQLRETHNSQVTRVACRVQAITQPSQSFSLTTRAASLASCGAVGKACKLAFSYGTESDPDVARTFLAKLTRIVPHTHAPMPPTTYKTTRLPIPIKAVTDAFTGMTKKSAPHRDRWTWELFRDMDGQPKTVDLLRTFVEVFAKGKLPKPLWKFLSSAIMSPFHKLALIERDLLKDPRMRPITIGTLVCRFFVRAILRMKRKGIVDKLLRDN